LKLDKMVSRRVDGALKAATCRADCMNAGSEGVVISRTSVGYSFVRVNIRVKRMTQSCFEEGGSGLASIPISPRTQGRHFDRVSCPPISIVDLIKTMLVHRPWKERSCKSVERRVRYLWTAVDASEEVLDPDVEDRRKPMPPRSESIEGTILGSEIVVVEEIRDMMERRVSSSAASAMVALMTAPRALFDAN